MLTWGLGHVCAVAVGVSLGLLGGGGSILAVPILVYVMGVGVKSAIAISLASVGMVSVIGTFFHWRAGNVRVDIALLFAPAAMLGAYLGAYVASFPWITEGFQLVCFSVMMLVASVLMIAKSRRTATYSVAQPSIAESPVSQPIVSQPIVSQPAKPNAGAHKSIILAEGLGLGMLTGFVGIGGGFAIVPALVLLTAIPMKQAVGTSLLIITLKSVTGFWGYVGQVDISWPLVGSFTLAACLGTVFGSYLNKLVNAKALQVGFGYFVLGFALLMIGANFGS